MTPDDEWILNYMRSVPDDRRTCTDAALQYLTDNGIRYTEYEYQHMKTVINRKMKIMEKYGMVRYTGRTVSANIRSKIWEVVE